MKPRPLRKQVKVKKPLGQRLRRAAAVGAVAVGIGAAALGIRNMQIADAKARYALFHGKTLRTTEWVRASRDLGISKKELRALDAKGFLNQQYLNMVEKKAGELGMTKDGVRRILETIARYGGDEYAITAWQNRMSQSKSPEERARCQRVISVISWFEMLPADQRKALGNIANAVDIPEPN